MSVSISIRPMRPEDRNAVAELVAVSTNFWYQARGNPPIFTGGPQSADVFYEVYDELDPGSGLVAVDEESGRLAGSCFVHPRETHVSLGILNTHPNYFGCGVARKILERIIEQAGGKPVRLVSSAANLDSFSLYTRAGFVPRAAYQDMLFDVPAGGFAPPTGAGRVRRATMADLDAVAALEMEISGIRRGRDYRMFVENASGAWSMFISETEAGADGWLAACLHPKTMMVGPGAARSHDSALALLHAQLGMFAGKRALALVAVEATPLVRQAYAWGAKNTEIHLTQVRGKFQPFKGVNFPTFLPESG